MKACLTSEMKIDSFNLETACVLSIPLGIWTHRNLCQNYDDAARVSEIALINKTGGKHKQTWVQKGSVHSVVLGANLQRERNVTRVEGAWENISALFFLLRIILQYVPR